MAEGILFGIAEQVLLNLGSKAVDEIALAWGFKDRLDRLKNTMNTINMVLLDAEQRQADSPVIRDWLERLTTAVYAADDLFDEVATAATRKQLLQGNNMSKQVRTFFSRSNQITFAFDISQKIKKIRQDLDDIVKDSGEFGFVIRPREEGGTAIKTRKGGEQTYSFVVADGVIGRDGDKKAILDLLLAPRFVGDDQEPRNEGLCVIPIVGIGGLGKTTLAQLIYNDPQVEQYFDMRLWVCIAEVLEIKEIVEKILKSVTNAESQRLEIEQLQVQLREAIGDKKYLLVMDDVWDESREKWLKLRDLLRMGGKGSKIVITTRSREVGKIMGTVPLYELQGLSDENSWDLFEKRAFQPGEAQQKPELVDIGKEIVKKCANVPLAIRALGSLLYGKDERKWFSFKHTNLAKITDNQSNVMSILKLSYQHLWSPLKNCFAYCSLFPKDYEFDKKSLIDLWIAEGFIIPKNHERLEELAEDYFLTLLQRCFFQDIKEDEFGQLQSFKMHDLMHDLALEVAGVKCKMVQLEESDFLNKTHHLSFAYSLTPSCTIPSWISNLKLVRTFLLPQQLKDGSTFSGSLSQQLISSFGCLRVLDLHNLGVKSLPNSIGHLVHLRYLDLSGTYIEELPTSITELQNLLTLKLFMCDRLQKLPTNIRKLVNLRCLNFESCDKLTLIPSGLGELTSLHDLPRFLVTSNNSTESSSKPNTAQLSDLKNLNNLRGVLNIEFRGNMKDLDLQANESNLSSKNGLIRLRIVMFSSPDDDTHEAARTHDTHEVVHIHDTHEAVLAGLKPNHNLKVLEIERYNGQKLPSWFNRNNLCINLPNLVHINLIRFTRCVRLPCFGQLPFLKRLNIRHMDMVEYIEMESSFQPSSSSMEKLFFPSLEELALVGMPKLKGLWKQVRTMVDDDRKKPHPFSVSFPKVSKLLILKCSSLMILPLCPNVEELTLVDTNETISVSKMARTWTSNSSSSTSYPKLKRLRIGNVEDLMSIPRECLHQLSFLSIHDKELMHTNRLGKFFKSTSLSSSLRSLEFVQCVNLRSISKGLEHLNALKKLLIWSCKELDLSSVSPFEREEDDDNMPWKAFENCLHSLELAWMPNLVVLPPGLQHLTALRSLQLVKIPTLKQLPEWISCLSSLQHMGLHHCPKLTFLPDGFRNLTSLNHLRIEACPGLTQRCRGPDGSDWPKIQHVPIVCVLD